MPSAPPRTAAEDGFTLVELLISATLMIVVLTASLAVANVVQRGQRDVTSRTDELGQATTGTERMSREIRQASALLAPVPSSISADTTATASTLQVTTRVLQSGVLKDVNVTYTCANGTLSRTQGTATRAIVRNVSNCTIFSVRNSGGIVSYVSFAIRVTTRGKVVTLSDGVDMRNV